MEDKKYKDGDLVRLKSGGPAMVVMCSDKMMVTCHWADGSKIKRADFEECTLVRFEK